MRCRGVRVVVWYMRCEGVRCGVVKCGGVRCRGERCRDMRCEYRCCPLFAKNRVPAL